MSNFMYDKRALIFSVGICLVGVLAVVVIVAARDRGSAAEGGNDQGASTGMFIDVPKPGDPWVSINLEGDVILEKGTHLEYPARSDPIEVMRLTHDGFIVVGERKIHIDTLAAVIERLAIAHERAVTE